MLWSGVYDEDDIDFLRAATPADGVFLDVGANVGLISPASSSPSTRLAPRWWPRGSPVSTRIRQSRWSSWPDSWPIAQDREQGSRDTCCAASTTGTPVGCGLLSRTSRVVGEAGRLRAPSSALRVSPDRPFKLGWLVAAVADPRCPETPLAGDERAGVGRRTRPRSRAPTLLGARGRARPAADAPCLPDDRLDERCHPYLSVPLAAHPIRRPTDEPHRGGRAQPHRVETALDALHKDRRRHPGDAGRRGFPRRGRQRRLDLHLPVAEPDRGRAVAVEPVPVNFDRLAAACRANAPTAREPTLPAASDPPRTPGSAASR